MTTLLRLSRLVCGASIVVAAVMWGWAIVRIRTSDANHVGFDLGALYVLFAAQIAAGAIGMWLSKRLDLLFAATLLVGAASVAGLYYVTSRHLLMSYEDWVKAGMPEAPEK